MKILLTACLLCIIGWSCQPGHDTDNDPPPPPVANDSTLISQYFELDTTGSPATDTLYKIHFTYDDHKRVTHITENSREIVNPVFVYNTVTDYYYNGNDTLPFKTTSITTDAGSIKCEAYYYYQNGMIISDSMITHDELDRLTGKQITTYFSSGDSIFYRSKGLSYSLSNPTAPPTVANYHDNIYRAVQNGNITVQKNIENAGSDYPEYTMTYNTTINPFRKAIIPYPVYEGKGYSYGTYNFLIVDVNNNVRFAQKNNMTEVLAKTAFGTIATHYKFFYEYNSNGYPKLVRISDLEYSDHRTGIFLYTK